MLEQVVYKVLSQNEQEKESLQILNARNMSQMTLVYKYLFY